MYTGAATEEGIRKETHLVHVEKRNFFFQGVKYIFLKKLDDKRRKGRRKFHLGILQEVKDEKSREESERISHPRVSRYYEFGIMNELKCFYKGNFFSLCSDKFNFFSFTFQANLSSLLPAETRPGCISARVFLKTKLSASYIRTSGKIRII